jgi:transposase
MAPEQSLARARKHALDRVARGEVTMTEAARQLGVSRSRLYELRHRYERYGEAGLFPKPRPTGRHPRALSPVLVDQILAYAIEHPTEGPRTIAARLGLARFGAWKVSHGSVSNVLTRAGLSRTRARLAAAEAVAAAEGGPISPKPARGIEIAYQPHVQTAVPAGEPEALGQARVGGGA